MIHKDNTNLYKADEGKMFVRKSDGFIMGNGIDLGKNDSIDNYEEREFSDEEIDEFYKKIGIHRPVRKPEPQRSPTQPVVNQKETSVDDKDTAKPKARRKRKCMDAST